MDSPIGVKQTPRPTQQARSPRRKEYPRRVKSPTLTSPIPDKNSSVLRPDHHVARPGYEEVYVIVHGATSLPSRSDGQDPLPFASLKSIADERGVRKAQSATHATLQATHSPVWEEILTMEVAENNVEEEEVILTISDSATKEKLVTYRIPIKNLVPFHPYHFELVQPTKSIGSGIRAYVTMQRRGCYLPRLHNFGFCGLEVVLRGFHRVLMTPAGPLLAVARIVPDYTIYKERMLSKQSAGITTATVTLPSPHPSAFEISDEQMQGFPQLTTASTGSDQPSWNHTFMFCGNDTATMFTHNSALVIEYYPATSSMSTVTWTIRNPIGFSTLLLDDEIFQALTSESGRLGVRVDDLLVQSSRFRSTENTLPSVDLVLRLINTERPDSLTAAAGFTILPTLDSMPKGTPMDPNTSTEIPTSPETNEGTTNGTPENVGPLLSEPSDLSEKPLYHRKKTQILVKEDEYPPSDILETILPEYMLTENDTNPSLDSKKKSQPKNRNTVRVVDNNNTMSLAAHQSRELQNYREAVKRMAADIGTLRSSVAKLQDENHTLRRELMMRKQFGEIIQSDIESGAVTTEEFADKFVSVKTKLNEEKGELKKYKDRVQHLQNQLIKANEREKNYLNEAVAVKGNEETAKATTKDKTQKMKKLENTVVQQEKVIEKMEKLLADYLKKEDNKKPRKNSYDEPADTTQQVTALLSQENARLRMENEELKIQNQREDVEKAQLQARLERAESRIASLEAQLEQNSRRWAQERHELSVRLQEHRNGFMRTTQPIGDGAGLRSSLLVS